MTHATQERGRVAKPLNRPVHTIRYGAIKAAIWRNMVDNGNASRPMYSVTFTRSYKDGKNWKVSSSFGLGDLLVLAKAMNDAHTFIHLRSTKDVAGLCAET